MDDDYDNEYMDEETSRLPAFPLREPHEFHILECDCKLNAELTHQLQRKFQSFGQPTTNMSNFITSNLHHMLSDKAASIFSWTGMHGNYAIMDFKVIDILIGSYAQIYFPLTHRHTDIAENMGKYSFILLTYIVNFLFVC